MPKQIQTDFNPKQALAWYYLNDTETTQILLGGAGNSGKTWFACWYITYMCLQVKGAVYVVARETLVRLKETTLKTLLNKIIREHFGLIENTDFTYNQTTHTIRFSNGSEILCKELQDKPSDPNFDSLGGLEITGALIDECNQVSIKAMNVLYSRIRHKLKEHNLKPVMLLLCNPAPGWVKTDFYLPSVENKLPIYRKYVHFTKEDNKENTPVGYLEHADAITRKRLLEASWYFDDDDTNLIRFDKYYPVFTTAEPESETFYLTLDPAGMGKDECVIMVWLGLHVVEIKSLATSTPKEIESLVNELCLKYNIFRRHIVYDAVSWDYGLDVFKGAVAFKSGTPAIGSNRYYENLRSQCSYRLADLINEGKVKVEADGELKDTIIQELQQLKRAKIDKDAKLAVITKDEIKRKISRSPNYLDAMLMRMYFELQTVGTGEYKYSFI